MPETSMSRTAPSTATSGTSAPRWRSPVAIRSSRPSTASASNWDAARPRVDRRFGQHPPEMAAKSQPRGFFRSYQRAYDAAVQTLLPQGLPEPPDPSDLIRSDRTERGAVGGFPPRNRNRNSGKRRTRYQGSACRTKTIRRTLSANLAGAGTCERERAAAAAGSSRAAGAIRSRLRRSRRAHDTRSDRDAECDAGGVSAARSERHYHCWPQRSRPLTRASRRSQPGAAGTLQRRLARAYLQA